MSKLSEFTMKSITGENVGLASYENQVCLIVNVASA
jgi:glutathione peroxidase-family protein